MTGELSSRKSEQHVWVGFVDDGTLGGEAVVVFGSQSAAAEAVHQEAVDFTHEFPLYGWLPMTGRFYEFISRILEDGTVEVLHTTESNSWPWFKQRPVEVVADGTGATRIVNVSGTDLKKVQETYEATVAKAKKNLAGEPSEVKTLAALLEASDDGTSYDDQARALLATGQVEVSM